MDANHFRDRAAKAREMARVGDDIRLTEMLLEVAADLEAEAEAIDAELRDANPLLIAPLKPGLPPMWGDVNTGSPVRVSRQADAVSHPA